MKVFCVFVAACLAVVAANECPSLADGKLEKLKAKLVTTDIHDQLVGDRKGVWGPKIFLELDPEACLKCSSTKKDDKVIEHTESFHNKGWIDGEFTSHSTMEKLENGVYLIKRGGTEPYGMAYYVYSKDHVQAHYMCKFNTGKEPGKKRWEQPFISYLNVDAAQATLPLEASIQKEVDEALAILQSDPELFGEVQQHTNVNC